jgi:hypothetical protein
MYKCDSAVTRSDIIVSDSTQGAFARAETLDDLLSQRHIGCGSLALARVALIFTRKSHAARFGASNTMILID